MNKLMFTKSQKQLGFAHVGLFMVIVVLTAMVAYTGWYVWQRNSSGPSANTGQGQECGPTWIDTHAHLDDMETPAALDDLMQDNQVSCTVLFAQLNSDDYDNDLELYRENFGGANPVYYPFADVVRGTDSKVTTEYLQKAFDATGGQLVGLGEFALYREELSNTDLTKEPWPTIYKFAADKNLFVMVHIGFEQKHLDAFKTVAKSYPDTKFLIHGFEQGPDGFANLLKENQNVYFTLDTATMLIDPASGAHYMYPNGRGSADQFVKDYADHKTQLLDYAKQNWSKVIEAAPDRVMWGTDVSFEWHVNQKVYERLVDFSEEFVASLPDNIRDKYQYQNAQRLLGERAAYITE